MTKVTSQRTFTGCWTCRRRNVRCDNMVPHCLQCTRSRISCEGYHIRLVWVDSKTGEYPPQQRRSYRCDLTWSGHSPWTKQDLDHLIEDSEKRQCRCTLHGIPSPFSSFHQHHKENETRSNNDVEVTAELSLDARANNENCEHEIGTAMARIFDMENMSAVVDIDIDALFTLGDTHETRPEERACFDGNKSQLTMSELILHEKTSLFASQDSWGTTMSIIRPPSASMVPGDREDRFLFSHYVSQVSMLMIPIEDGENPWKSTYPSLALQERSSCSTRSLYNAILAQSAFHLASVKGAERGACDNARAVRHYGTALRELRNSLATPTEEYSSVLAALMTVIFVETVSQGQYRAWRHHFRGAMGFVSQYLSQKPWSLSRDAWNITQSFVLDMVLAYTAVHPSTTTDHISKLSGILGNVTREPRFGFTIGGNARLINTIYRILLLEEQFSAARYLQHGQLANEDLHTQAEEIVQELRISLEDDVDLYIKHQEIGSLKTLPRARLLVKLHLQLFNKGVLIYLLRMVLRHPPAAVADYVGEVLTDAIVFLDMNGGEPSIWPVFVAAVEAYTPESQALADHFFDESKTRGTGTREEMRSVIRQVWADRERLSAERQCSVGGIAIDWREVTKKMDVDILLL